MPDTISQIKIRLISKEADENLKISDAPLHVPVNLKRYGLSEIVNHLLNSEEKKEESNVIPFEFLVDGHILSGSIEDYLTKNGLSSEAFITLEYTRAVLPPSFLASFDNEDWISSLDSINNSLGSVTCSNLKVLEAKILSGSYDGIVRTYNLSGGIEKMYSGHSGAVTAVKWITPTRIVSASNDRTLRLWKASIDESEENSDATKTLAILEGHKEPVMGLAVDYITNRILSAGYDNNVCFWSTHQKEMPLIEVPAVNESTLSTASKKRRKMAFKDASIKRRSPLSILEGHTQPVEDVIFDKHDSTVGYSVSQDHSVKTWDLVTSKCIDTRNTSYSLLSILQLPEANLLACGSSARHINLYDPRITSTSREQTNSIKLVGHSNFVVSLAKDPNSDYMFASGSHDGTVKIWDIRSEKSMFTIFRDANVKKGLDKVFAVAWDKEIGIISGGQDKKVQINTGNHFSK